jgi:hypothetical protein
VVRRRGLRRHGRHTVRAIPPAGEQRPFHQALLDRIDEIVPPGTNLNHSDRGYDPPALTTPSLRRRPA